MRGITRLVGAGSPARPLLLALLFATLVLLAVTSRMPAEAQESQEDNGQDGSQEPNTAAGEARNADSEEEERLLNELGETSVYRDSETGRVHLIGAPEGGGTIDGGATVRAASSPEEAARAHLDVYGPLFGIRDGSSELRVKKTKRADGENSDRSVVRFQQVYGEVPVIGGELNTQVDSSGGLLEANGEVSPNLSLDLEPTVGAGEAEETALEKVTGDYEVDRGGLRTTEPELWIYDPGLIGEPEDGDEPRLVWRLEVTNDLDIRELVLVDAETGEIALNFSQIAHARDRKTHTANNTDQLPGELVCDESDPSCAAGNDEAKAAHRYAGATYDFYKNYHGRDSLDGKGLTLVSTVNYCPDQEQCPYKNALWNGEQMVYGEGLARAEDVVGHELTHGVTGFESGLFYYYQAGAINESFSDLWGEFVELTDPTRTIDSKDRWKIGQDLPKGDFSPEGELRDMKDPTRPLGDGGRQPDRMKSPLYFAGPTLRDVGGVHVNSGVNNKAIYLMTDGDTFNGKTIEGLGVEKVAKIYYEVQTNLLTSGSDYQNLYGAVRQSCTSLTGTSGITKSDCEQVKKALDATEMNDQPPVAKAPEAPVCNTRNPKDKFFDDMENQQSGNWVSTNPGDDEWRYVDYYATSGKNSLFGLEQKVSSDSSTEMTSDVKIPPKKKKKRTYLHFRHAYAFDIREQNEATEQAPFVPRDGAVLEYSSDKGQTWKPMSAKKFTHNGYDGTISDAYDNPLGGRKGFVGESHGYVSSRVNVSFLAGKEARFRFRAGSDTRQDKEILDLSDGEKKFLTGWFVDDVRIYNCGR